MLINSDSYSQKFNFRAKNCFRHLLEVVARYIYTKKSEKSNEAILHKVQKTLFLDVFLPKYTPKIFFWALSHFRHYHFASLWKKSEKTNGPIPRKAGKEERTNMDGRTNVKSVKSGVPRGSKGFSPNLKDSPGGPKSICLII